MTEPTALPELDKNELKRPPVQTETAAALIEAEPRDTTEKASSSVSLVLMMTLAACLGFGIMQIDFGELGGNKRGGQRQVVWRKMMKTIGVDIEQYRAERVRKYGADAQFADDGAISDLQMFVTDAMGPRD